MVLYGQALSCIWIAPSSAVVISSNSNIFHIHKLNDNNNINHRQSFNLRFKA